MEGKQCDLCRQAQDRLAAHYSGLLASIPQGMAGSHRGETFERRACPHTGGAGFKLRRGGGIGGSRTNRHKATGRNGSLTSLEAMTARLRRRAIMEAARVREAARRAGERQAGSAGPIYWQPSAALLAGLKAGSPRRWTKEAVLDAHQGMMARRQWAALAASEPTNEGRQSSMTLQGFQGTNGSRTMAARRWTLTGRVSRLVPDSNGQPVKRLGWLDWLEGKHGQGATDCYSVQPDGSRTVFSPPVKAGKAARKPRKSSAAADKAARMRQAAGTIRMGDQD